MRFSRTRIVVAVVVAALCLCIPASAKLPVPERNAVAFLHKYFGPQLEKTWVPTSVKTSTGWNVFVTIKLHSNRFAIQIKVCEDKRGKPFRKRPMSDMSGGTVSCDRQGYVA